MRRPSACVLSQRLLSALILIPLVLCLAYLGRQYFDGLVAACGAVMGWEWGRMRGGGRLDATAVLGMLVVPASVAAASLAGFDVALGVLGGGAALIAAAAALSGDSRVVWAAAGPAYVGAPCLALLWLRGDPQAGLFTVLWLLAVVWAADTGAFFAGRLIGGPKLLPVVSPNKTWAGLGGAIVAAAIVGLAFGIWLNRPSIVLIASVSAGLGLVEQLGDLLESAVKRRFGVKDSSTLIPGHGGLLDRVDGLMTAALAVAGISMLAGGSVLTWR